MIEKKWQVYLHKKITEAIEGKRKKKALPLYVIEALESLKMDIECFGPTLGTNRRN